MAASSSPSILLANPVPKISCNNQIGNKVSAFNQRSIRKLGGKYGSRTSRLIAAGLSEIEPDLNEDPRNRWATPGVDAEDFKYGEWDGHHTYFEGQDKRTYWEILKEEYTSTEPPAGFQGFISWIFLPAVSAGMYFNVPGEYLFIGAGLFVFIFCVIEMDKPDKPHNFEPQIYNMERGARDKLIDDYNTMSKWDFNEKYGDLWDFTITREDITKR
ncbi:PHOTOSYNTHETIC NDH SUBUNIT OF SUBCOMPLEX B 5 CHLOROPLASTIC [Salix viminalis]|uniref:PHOTOSYNTHETIC NDH SUBUNIT OF SUBCOMPLEX B 5 CHLOROPLASTIC n=1 Tax=Salix viminalis TaxID=40686 RepID=A0A6N2M357_SALVM|nr:PHOTOSYNTHETIC NDH SUBUNIT OF SUBCOMPLEX B 5 CHLOROPLASTIC [Salix viminalis]